MARIFSLVRKGYRPPPEAGCRRALARTRDASTVAVRPRDAVCVRRTGAHGHVGRHRRGQCRDGSPIRRQVPLRVDRTRARAHSGALRCPRDDRPTRAHHPTRTRRVDQRDVRASLGGGLCRRVVRCLRGCAHHRVRRSSGRWGARRGSEVGVGWRVRTGPRHAAATRSLSPNRARGDRRWCVGTVVLARRPFRAPFGGGTGSWYGAPHCDERRVHDAARRQCRCGHHAVDDLLPARGSHRQGPARPGRAVSAALCAPRYRYGRGRHPADHGGDRDRHGRDNRGVVARALSEFDRRHRECPARRFLGTAPPCSSSGSAWSGPRSSQPSS